MWIRLGHPGVEQLDRRLAATADDELTYDHVGTTLPPFDGRRPLRTFTLPLGQGADAFERASAGLRAWVCHPGIGASIHPSDAPLEVGTTLFVVLRVGPLRIAVPDRIVAVVDEPGRFGFAYGTLAGHAERGEESFLVERLEDGSVRGAIHIDATPANLLLRIGAPLLDVFQRNAARGYLRALQRFVSAGEDSGPPG